MIIFDNPATVPAPAGQYSHVARVELGGKTILQLSGQVAIDADRKIVGNDYVRGDFLTHPFEPASFDVVTTVAALHHMDVTAALGQVHELLKPGGVMCAVGRPGRSP